MSYHKPTSTWWLNSPAWHFHLSVMMPSCMSFNFTDHTSYRCLQITFHVWRQVICVEKQSEREECYVSFNWQIISANKYLTVAVLLYTVTLFIINISRYRLKHCAFHCFFFLANCCNEINRFLHESLLKICDFFHECEKFHLFTSGA